MDLLYDMGFERAAVLDLRRLGSKEGFDVRLAEDSLSHEMGVLYGGGVRESDLAQLKSMGALGGLVDPYTPVLRDLISSGEELEDERPLPSPVPRESPRGLGLDA